MFIVHALQTNKISEFIFTLLGMKIELWLMSLDLNITVLADIYSIAYSI